MKTKLPILLVFILLLACTTPQPEPLPTLAATAVPLPTLPVSLSNTTPLSSSGQTAAVTYIVDGDTIDVELAGSIYQVRYIGMDTPERGDFFITKPLKPTGNWWKAKP